VRRGLEDTYGEPIPFAKGSDKDRVAVLAAPYVERLTDDQLALLRKWLAFRLGRIDVEGGVPVRLYPFSRDPAEDSPRTVVIDPRVRFGRPTVANRGVPTDILFERFQAGDTVAGLADDYGFPAPEVEEAIRYEALHPIPFFPFYDW
jgi:uncharacterized protein (DUF433 family)